MISSIPDQGPDTAIWTFTSPMSNDNSNVLVCHINGTRSMDSEAINPICMSNSATLCFRFLFGLFVSCFMKFASRFDLCNAYSLDRVGLRKLWVMFVGCLLQTVGSRGLHTVCSVRRFLSWLLHRAERSGDHRWDAVCVFSVTSLIWMPFAFHTWLSARHGREFCLC